MDWDRRNNAPLEAMIRPARRDDAEFLIALSDLVFRKYVERAARSMVRMMNNPNSAIVVAEAVGPHQAGIRLGFAVVNIKRINKDFGPLRRPAVAHLDAIAVRPNLANRGIGRRLLDHAESVARAEGAVSMSLLTATTNKSAQALFLRAGYQTMTPAADVYDDGQNGLVMWRSL
jgi:ribosomal protein S18 acetylase RimI-like enzyme